MNTHSSPWMDYWSILQNSSQFTEIQAIPSASSQEVSGSIQVGLGEDISAQVVEESAKAARQSWSEIGDQFARVDFAWSRELACNRILWNTFQLLQGLVSAMESFWAPWPSNPFSFLSSSLRYSFFYSQLLLSQLITSKCPFLHFNFIQKRQRINTIKLQLIDPETKLFYTSLMRISMNPQKDINALNKLKSDYAALKKRIGVSAWVPAILLAQIPVMVNWFFSLKKSCSESLFPGMKTDGFLWFTDLTASDPYFVLPLLNAALSTANLFNSPVQNLPMDPTSKKIMDYLRFSPFLFIPVFASFPAVGLFFGLFLKGAECEWVFLEKGVNIYMCTMALTHLTINLLGGTQAFRKLTGIGEYFPGTILECEVTKKLKNISEEDWRE